MQICSIQPYGNQSSEECCWLQHVLLLYTFGNAVQLYFLMRGPSLLTVIQSSRKQNGNHWSYTFRKASGLFHMSIFQGAIGSKSANTVTSESVHYPTKGLVVACRCSIGGLDHRIWTEVCLVETSAGTKRHWYWKAEMFTQNEVSGFLK